VTPLATADTSEAGPGSVQDGFRADCWQVDPKVLARLRSLDQNSTSLDPSEQSAPA
jgi:hypothetical protein